MNSISITVTPIYTAAIAILMVILSTRVAILRGEHSVALGDGAVPGLALAIRRFGNLTEYAATALLILLLLELRRVDNSWLHTYGTTLVSLRVLHALVLFDDINVPISRKAGRFIAAGGTAALLFAGAVALMAV